METVTERVQNRVNSFPQAGVWSMQNSTYKQVFLYGEHVYLVQF